MHGSAPTDHYNQPQAQRQQQLLPSLNLLNQVPQCAAQQQAPIPLNEPRAWFICIDESVTLHPWQSTENQSEENGALLTLPEVGFVHLIPLVLTTM